MSEKVSTITLRLTAEEAAQLEILKDIIGKKRGVGNYRVQALPMR